MRRNLKETSVTTHNKGSGKQAFAFSAITIVVILSAAYLLFTGLFPPLPESAPNTIDVLASMSGFNTSNIRVRVGEEVTIRLTSLDNQYHADGGGQHQWAVDELELNVIAPSLGSNSVTFTPTRPGTYTFYCDICCGGRANPSMQGTLVVEA